MTFLLFNSQRSSISAQEAKVDFNSIKNENEEAEFNDKKIAGDNGYRFGQGVFFYSKNKNLLNRLNAYIQVSGESRVDTNQSATFNRFRIRRAYINFSGRAYRQRLRYRLRINFAQASVEGIDSEDPVNPNNASNPILLDAFFSYNFTRRFRITFGQRSTYADNREIRINSWGTQFPERSPLTSAFASIREFGIYLDGSFRGPNGSAIKPYFTLTSGDGLNAFGRNYGGLKYGFRLDFLPTGVFARQGEYYGHDVWREPKVKSVFGFIFTRNQGITSRRGRNSGRFLYFDSSGDTIIPADYEKNGFDLMIKHRGWTIFFEYVTASAHLAADSVFASIASRTLNYGQTTSETNPTTVIGVDETGSAIREPITYQQHIRNQLILGNAWNLQFGYLFRSKWTIDLRYTEINAAQSSFLNNTLFYSRPRQFTIGTTKYFSGIAHKMQLSWSYATVRPNTRRADGLSINAPGEYYTRLLWQFVL